MRIIPAIDIIEGKCVRLTKGDFNDKTVYDSNPLDVAKMFEDYGFKYLHLVDLDGAKSRRVINYKILEQIASKTNLIIDFGGGLKSNEDIKIVFDSGASQVTGGSIAVKQPSIFMEWIEKFGSEKIILGADVKNQNIAIDGWLKVSNNNIFDFIDNFQKKGVRYVICTDIEKDGVLEGLSFDQLQDLLESTRINVIASGGVASLEDIKKLKKISIKNPNLVGVIVGKAIYENRLKVDYAVKLLNEKK